MSIVVKDANGDDQTISTIADLVAVVSTATKQEQAKTVLDNILTALGTPTLASGASTETTSAAILAKLSGDPATQTTLAAILAKIISAPATEGKQDTIIAALATLVTQTDGVETLLTTIDGRVDGIEGLIGTTNSTLTTIDGRVDGLETLIGATNTALGIGAATLLKAEDAVAASGDAGVMALAVRTDAGTALAGTTGDYIPFTTDALGRLWVAGSQAEDVASADGDRGMAALAVRKATPANTSGTDGDYEFLQMSGGYLWVAHGTGTTHLLKAEDAAHVSGDAGVMMLGVRSDSPTPTSATAGDYVPPIMDAGGRVHVRESLDEYETVAASQTAQALGATGATGDIIAGILVIPATTSPGNVILLDNATSITVFTGGAGSVLSLVPFFIPLGLRSVSGAWKITTGANVSCIGIGDFT